MKIAVLTSSRADYSIYLPLLKKLQQDAYFELSIIAFGTHLSKFHGHTIDSIINDGFHVAQQVESLVIGDSPEAISSTMALTVQKFASIWANVHYDCVLVLGDRFEMFAAVMSSAPFNLKLAHLHGGETTLGAIDNALRHAISLMSSLHFVSTEQYRERLVNILGDDKNVYNVGALSLENMQDLKLYDLKEFETVFGIDMSKPTILSTFHPETVAYDKNKEYIKEFLGALAELKDYQILITMPNIDTMSDHIRQSILDFAGSRKNIFTKESLGTVGYLSAMKHCAFVIGNSSSGFVDASFFPKKVINVGYRQLGRLITPNIFNCAIDKQEILKTIDLLLASPELDKIMAYGDGRTSDKIINILKNEL